MSESVPLEDWPHRLEAAIEHSSRLRRVLVVRETNSTQDAARRLNARDGDVIVAWDQTSGRGRRGRSWACGTDGVALTFVLEPESRVSRSIFGAIVAAKTIESFLGRLVQIKWPNDIHVDGRKIAGVLIEQDDDRAVMGIGMNVGQREWPPDLQGIAVSLHELGATVDRVEVIERLFEMWDESIMNEDGEGGWEAYFTRRDCLTGKAVRVRHDGRTHTGRLKRLNPFRDLVIETASGEVRLPAATTAILEVIDES